MNSKQRRKLRRRCPRVIHAERVRLFLGGVELKHITSMRVDFFPMPKGMTVLEWTIPLVPR